MQNEPLRILLVEDDEIDVRHFRRSMRQEQVPCEITVAGNGLEALDHMRGTGGRERLDDPYIVVLDINMPRMNGHDLLTEVRKDPSLSRMVVFMMTTSQDANDIALAYNAHVAGYVVKGTTPGDGASIAGFLQTYWSSVMLPVAA
ncbi:MAG: response regulator [Geminicoccaceae bacterium]|nr:response regulator [Geminicoccaceae bacterium]